MTDQTGHGAVTVVPVDGDVDLNTSADVTERIRRAIRPGSPVLIIDMTGVSFLSAHGMSLLAAMKERAEATGVDLRLVACRQAVLRPLQICGLSATFDIYPTVAAARHEPTTDK